MVGKSLEVPAQITALVCCWELCLADSDVLSGCIPMPVASGLSHAWQPHAWHLWETFKWPKALTQGECSTATSFGSATTACTAAVSQVLTLTLSNAKGFAVTWKSKMGLQKHLPKARLCWSMLALWVLCLPPSHHHRCISTSCRHAVPHHMQLVASGKGLGLQDTRAPASIREAQRAQMFL